MRQESYPTPHREGVYQDGLRKAIMQRVSGSSPAPSGTQVQGPLMGAGRIRRAPYRLGRRPGFDATRPTARVPREVGPIAERGGRSDQLADAIAARLRDLLGGGEGRGLFEREPGEGRLPMERRGRPDVFAALAPPDPWEAWLASVPRAPSGMGMLPEIPTAPGPLDPELVLEMLRRYLGGGMAI